MRVGFDLAGGLWGEPLFVDVGPVRRLQISEPRGSTGIKGDAGVLSADAPVVQWNVDHVDGPSQNRCGPGTEIVLGDLDSGLDFRQRPRDGGSGLDGPVGFLVGSNRHAAEKMEMKNEKKQAKITNGRFMALSLRDWNLEDGSWWRSR